MGTKKNLRFFVIMTNVLFWLMLGLCGLLMALGLSMETISKYASIPCSWESFFVLMLWAKKKVDKRMQEMRLALREGDILDKFDRIVFESIVDKVIVGEINEDGSVDPYKLSFVLKGNGGSALPDAKKHFKKSKSMPQKDKTVV